MPKRFRASNAAQLMECPGSANLELAIPGYEDPPEKTTGAAPIGTAAHEIMEPFTQLGVKELKEIFDATLEFQSLHYTKRRPIADDLNKTLKFIGDNKWTTIDIHWFRDLNQFTPKMMRFIAACAERILYLKEKLVGVTYKSEVSTEAQWLDSAPRVTTDVVIYSPSYLHVIDYKTGQIPVDAAGNAQLMFYAATLLDLAPNAEEILVEIIQPGNNSMWVVRRKFLERWMQLAREADRRVSSKDLTLVPGDHCTFCPANPHTRGEKSVARCPAKYNQLYPPRVDTNEIFDL